MVGEELNAIILFRDIGVIIVMATIFNLILKKLGQPSFLAYILTGLFIGPFMFNFMGGCVGFLYGDTCVGLNILGVKSPADDANIQLLSAFGVALLLFSVGVETKVSKLKKMGSLIVVGGTLQVAIVAAVVFALSFFSGLLNFAESIYLGSILAFSSTMVVVKLLSDRFEIDTLQGRLMIGFLLVQDFLIVLFIPLLAKLNVLFDLASMRDVFVASLVLIGVALVFNRVIFPRIFTFSSRNPELLFLTGLSSALIFMALAELILDLPMALGAFIGGLALSTLPYNVQIYDEIRGVRDFFLTIFFVTLGMQLTFPFTANALPLLALMLFGVFLLKPFLFFIFTLLGGYGGRTAFFVGLGLAQVSEFSFVLAGQGLSGGIISQDFYSMTILVVAISMVATTYIFKYSNSVHAFSNWARARLPKTFLTSSLYRNVRTLRESRKVSDHVVIMGGGMVGGSIAQALVKDNQIVVVDHNPVVVEQLGKKGINTIYGQTDNRLVWEKLNIKNARLVIVAIPFAESALRFIDHVRKLNPEVPIFARAHTFDQASRLYHHKCNYVCILPVVGANLFLKTIFKFMETQNLNELVPLQDEYMDFLKLHAEHEEQLPLRDLYGDDKSR